MSCLPGTSIPSSRAIASAVARWSPVIIATSMLRPAAGLERRLDLGPRRVLHGERAQEDEPLLQRSERRRATAARRAACRRRHGPEPLRGQPVVSLEYDLAVLACSSGAPRRARACRRIASRQHLHRALRVDGDSPRSHCGRSSSSCGRSRTASRPPWCCSSSRSAFTSPAASAASSRATSVASPRLAPSALPARVVAQRRRGQHPPEHLGLAARLPRRPRGGSACRQRRGRR